MDVASVDEDPVARRFVELAESRDQGSLQIGGRSICIAGGEVVEVSGGEQDLDLGEFALRSGKISQAQLEAARALVPSLGVDLAQALVSSANLSPAELRVMTRALWLDRFVRALRDDRAAGTAPAPLGPAAPPSPAAFGVALLAFVLDALARLAADHDATLVGRSLNHRLSWIDGPQLEEAKRWASFGDTGERPVVSILLARLPAVAPQIAALVRAGFARLDAPGVQVKRPKSKTGTLPPPPPRLSMLPGAPPVPVSVAPAAPGTLRPLARPPRLRLDPGADGIPVESIPSAPLPVWRVATAPQPDPLRVVELRIAALEARAAPGPERARAFVELARLWQSRLGSLEEAARALREAAAADPSDAQVLQDAALHCSYLGQLDLAVSYATAAVGAAPISIDRAAAYRLISEIHRTTDATQQRIEALSEAAAEDPTHPEAHELLAPLLAEQDNFAVASAHAAMAARVWVDQDPKRAAMLYATAYAWNPADVALAEDYARVLVALELPEAAVAVLEQTARNTPDPIGRGAARASAAAIADAARLPHLARDPQLEAWDDSPGAPEVQSQLAQRARSQDDPLVAARALAALARHGEDSGDFDGAIRSADAALAADPRAADACFVVLRHAHRLDPERAVALLSRAREVLGDSAPLLAALAQAALAAHDRTTHLVALRAWSELSPLDPEPRLRSLATRVTADDAAALYEEAEALLRDAGGPTVTAAARETVERLAALSAHGIAARLAARVQDELGRRDPSCADRAVALARASQDHALLTAALERAASAHDGEARRARLLELSEHHRASSDGVGETRALLRVLALDMRDGRALDRLATLFAAAGDGPRLETVLTLSLGTLVEPEARRRALLSLVSAAMQIAHDRELALAHLRVLLAESEGDRDWLLVVLGVLFSLGDTDFAIERMRELAGACSEESGGALYLWTARKLETDLRDGGRALELAIEGAQRFPVVGELLLMVERLTLPERDSARALSVYDALLHAAVGPHGQRAIHYRAGRWLERAGSLASALEHYEQAFALAKGAGVAFRAIERVAQAAGSFGPLVSAQEALADTLRDDTAAVSMLREAASVCLTQLDDAPRGLALLLRADAIAGISDFDAELVAAAHRVRARDEGEGERALREITAAWEERAEKLWDADMKARLLLRAAAVHLRERSDPEASLRSLAPVMAVEARGGLSQQLAAATLAATADALITAGRENDAATALEEALRLAPDDAQALAVRDRLRPRPPAPGNAPEAPSRVATRPEWVSATADDELALRARVEAGDTRALEALWKQLSKLPARRAEARALLNMLVRAEPFRVDALRRLHDDALSEGASAEAAVCAQILALFDPRAAPPRHSLFHTGQIASAELWRLLDIGRPERTPSLFALLWEHAKAIPRFRRSIDSYGVGPRQRVSLQTDSAAAMAFARAARLLGRTDTPLYLKPRAQPALTVVPTHPPSIIARSDLAEMPALTYRMAQCVVWADANNALLCVVPEEEGRDLLAAAIGAFGPTNAQAGLSRSAKEVASQLWHTVPMRVQSELRELVSSQPSDLDYSRARQKAVLAAHRAGLYVLSDVRLALEALGTLDPALRQIDLRTESGFQTAASGSATFAELIRTALSDPYLALTAQAI